jgi:hypothetical protein
MNFLCITDLHREEACLDYLKAFLEKEKFDAVLCCGDLQQADFASDVFDLIASFKIPCFCVFGNIDSQPVIDVISRKAILVHRRTYNLREFLPKNLDAKKLKIAGIGGAIIGGLNTIQEYTEGEFEQILSALDADENTILVCHTPPEGFFDFIAGKSRGSVSLKRFIELKKPLAVVCGHLHEFEGVEKLGPTLIIKVATMQKGKAAKLEVPGPKVEFLKL